MNDQVAIERQLDARRQAQCLLKRRVATGIPAGVEVGETIQRAAVVSRVVHQMGDAEVHAATTPEHFVASRAFPCLGVVTGASFGEGDADLHRPAGAYRVELAEQLAAQRYD